MAIPPPSPRTIDDIELAWLNHVLPDQAISAVDVQPLAEGVGLLASVALLVCVTSDGPLRIVAKLPSDSPQNRGVAEHFRYYEREANTYRHLQPSRFVRTPAARAVVDGPDGPIMLLDHLLATEPADQLSGATLPQAEAVIDALADAHRGFWKDATLAEQAWLPDPSHWLIAGYGDLFDMMWEQCKSLLDGELPDTHRRAAAIARSEFDDVCRSFAAGPHTLVHGDARLDNFLFDDASLHGEGAMPIDWQLAARGRGVYDVAFFLAGSCATDFRREHEETLLARYVDRLAIADYGIDECRADYRRGHILNLPNPVTALVAVDPGSERGRQMLRANALRGLAAVADLV